MTTTTLFVIICRSPLVLASKLYPYSMGIRCRTQKHSIIGAECEYKRA